MKMTPPTEMLWQWPLLHYALTLWKVVTISAAKLVGSIVSQQSINDIYTEWESNKLREREDMMVVVVVVW